MPVSWLEHAGRRVLYVDYRDLGAAERIDTLHQQSAAIEASPAPVRTLVDARGARFTTEFLLAAREAGVKNSVWTIRRAVVGAEGYRMALLKFFNEAVAPVPMKPFETIEDALAYLTES